MNFYVQLYLAFLCQYVNNKIKQLPLVELV